ncbi:MAG: tRNA (mo5U34)-methyltransferase [Solirubrobacteraceae bacterium]|jgi:hypothetical protein|nr:tRNA (mo5U34)-methyltransferase [Solirubrobacteraceae bacterium]
MDIGTLRDQLGDHVAALAAAREASDAAGDGVRWYPYDILGNVIHLDALLGDAHRDLGALAGGLPIADIGGADGDLAFTLERAIGAEVDFVDYGPTNMNLLAGVRALRDRLGSSVEVVECDLDTQFELPRERYGLVLLLGILYHLQNPFFVLRRLAERAEHLVLSTRVVQVAGPADTRVDHLPVAYLVDPEETNGDATNYWMFTTVGLERLARRAGWDVLARHHVGCTVDSDPSSPDRDERCFLLLRRAG